MPVLLDLTSAPGRTVVFTRTKHGAKRLARQLNDAGVPAVELHGNLSQNARTRNMDAFHTRRGQARSSRPTSRPAASTSTTSTSSSTPTRRSSTRPTCTARAARPAPAPSGTVVTLMTDEQVRDVRDLTRKAGIKPTITRVHAEHPVLSELAPGERALEGAFVGARPESSGQGGGGRRGGGRGQAASGGAPRAGGPRRSRGPRSEGRSSSGPAQPRRGSGNGAGGSGRRGGRGPGSGTSVRSAASFSEGTRPQRSR